MTALISDADELKRLMLDGLRTHGATRVRGYVKLRWSTMATLTFYTKVDSFVAAKRCASAAVWARVAPRADVERQGQGVGAVQAARRGE